MRRKRKEIPSIVNKIVENSHCPHARSSNQIPRISLITSLYDGDDQVEGFLRDITSQTIFENCELIIVDGNSPGNEAQCIRRYQEKFDNIVYLRLDNDPGIYGCWNKAIELSSGEFISNANIDDRRSHQQLEILAQHLADNPLIDLVYSEFYVTHKANESFLQNSSNFSTYPSFPFSPTNMSRCLPGCMPVWRKSMHDKHGLFDSSLKFAGDWEMWLRAASGGSVFSRKAGVHGLYYHNPRGLTTSKDRESEKVTEEVKVRKKYSSYIQQT
jgi:glycosyltransferase involved in cell wall biosynthesis